MLLTLPALISLGRGTSCPLSQEIKADLCGEGGKHCLCPCQVLWYRSWLGMEVSRAPQDGGAAGWGALLSSPQSCCLARGIRVRCPSKDCALRGEASPSRAWWIQRKTFLLPALPHLGMKSKDPSLPPSQLCLCFGFFVSPSPPWLFSLHCDAVSGFTNIPSSRASPSSSKLLICLGALAVGWVWASQSQKMQWGLLQVGPVLSLLGSAGINTSV